jgi:hypothetical protein
MATVPCEDENIGWDPVEDEQPDQVDLVLASPRPRVLLSIGQWVRKYCEWLSVEEAPRILELEERPVAKATTLDCKLISIGLLPKRTSGWWVLTGKWQISGHRGWMTSLDPWWRWEPPVPPA